MVSCTLNVPWLRLHSFCFCIFFPRFIWAFMYNLMISWNPFAHPSLSLVISYNEDGYNEDAVRQLLYAPDFEDI